MIDKFWERECHSSLPNRPNNTCGPLSKDKPKHTEWVQTPGISHCSGEEGYVTLCIWLIMELDVFLVLSTVMSGVVDWVVQ